MSQSAIKTPHPPSLFVLFFTEMWERFSYYGMRAILVLFLISSVVDGGWAWDRADALKLYAFYTGLVYLTPILGGYIADKWLGFRKSVILGAGIMTAGHASMAMDTHVSFYTGLVLLIIGNGLFKPNISSMVGKLYEKDQDKKDSAYTIFYMGINSGGFLGMLLCGYLGEMVGWSYGFGLAGIFMFFGMVMFMFGQKIFGNIGLSPSKQEELKEQGLFEFEEPELQKEAVIEHKTPKHIQRDRTLVIGIFSISTIFFWMTFEQAGGSMTIFSEAYTQRVLSGAASTTFKIVNSLLTVVPLLILTVVLINLVRKTYRKIPLSNLFLSTAFVIIWGIVVWKLNRDLPAAVSEVPASWFSILNSFFIISLAPIFSKVWESKINPSGPVKFGIGLILVGIGFALLAYGSSSIPPGAKTASVSMIWLILAYLFHTMGELCVSPVGLSYVSKLAPPKLVGLMFGLWFFCTFLGNFLAGFTGSFIDKIMSEHSLTFFFLIYTFIPAFIGVIMIALNRFMIKKMHGFR